MDLGRFSLKYMCLYMGIGLGLLGIGLEYIMWAVRSVHCPYPRHYMDRTVHIGHHTREYGSYVPYIAQHTRIYGPYSPYLAQHTKEYRSCGTCQKIIENRKIQKFVEKSKMFKWPYLQFPCIPNSKYCLNPDISRLPQQKQKNIYWVHYINKIRR